MESRRAQKRARRPRKLTGPNGLKLKQVVYRAFPHDITIYHFQGNHTSVYNLRTRLNRADGYVDTLLSSDPILSLRTPLPEDDVIPKGRIEVAYLPDVFHLGGSALGFRMDKGVVQWMCFDQPIDQTILQRTLSGKPRTDNSLMLFDHVGTLAKTVQDHTGTYRTSEHRGWHHSLAEAYHRPLKLSLTWRNKETEMQADRDARYAEYAREKQEQELANRASTHEGFVRNKTEEKGQAHTYRLLQMYESHITVKTPTRTGVSQDENVDTRSKMPHSRSYLSPPGSDSSVWGD